MMSRNIAPTVPPVSNENILAAVQALRRDLQDTNTMLGDLSRSRGDTIRPTLQLGSKKGEQEAQLRLQNDRVGALQLRLNQAMQEKNDLLAIRKELEHKVAVIQKALTKAGLEGQAITDEEVVNDFMQLKRALSNFARGHLPGGQYKWPDGSSADISDRKKQSQLATVLHSEYFAEDVLLFGFENNNWNKTLKDMESHLQALGFIDDALRDWRVSTIRMGQSLARESSEDIRIEEAEKIWQCKLEDSLGSISAAGMADFGKICSMARNLAIKLRASKVEYEWGQPMKKRYKAEYEIVGQIGQFRPGAMKVAFVAFGNISKGDRITGLLKDSKVLLAPAEIAVTEA